MFVSFEEFKNSLQLVGLSPEYPVPACPIKLNPFCLAKVNNCEAGKNNSCPQYFDFFIGSTRYSLPVLFYGTSDGKGIINLDASSVVYFVKKNKATIGELADLKKRLKKVL